MSNTTFGSVRTTVLGLAAAFTTAAEAAGTPPKSMLLESSFIEDIGASEHIVYAAKLRILGQRIPAAACYQHAGIEKEASAELLQKSVYEFNRIIEGLKYGDAELGLMKAETDRKVLEDIKQVYDVWNPLHAKIDEVMARGSTDDDILYFAAQAYLISDGQDHQSPGQRHIGRILQPGRAFAGRRNETGYRGQAADARLHDLEGCLPHHGGS